MKWIVTSLAAVSLTAAVFAQRGAPPPGAPVISDTPRFRYMGPESSGRIAAVAGIPGDSNTYYAGAASGGVWKTTDGAKTFEPVFDDQPVQAIGALAVSQSNPSIVWAGTGEAWTIRDSDVTGDGAYKSTDAGKTWTNVGLKETGRIGRVIVHPTNPDIVYVCALGRATGPQQERGVFKTTDGGRTWSRSLFADQNTGCSGLAIDAHDPNSLLAGMWQVELHTWAEISGGPGSAVYQTRDGGATWKKLENGLPKSPVGKIDVAIAPSNAQRLFALIQTANQGSLWRSDDGGNAWKVVSWDRRLIGRAGYYIRIDVNPVNADEVLVANSSFHRSLDGGANFTISQGGGCGDCHDIWMDPKNGDHWIATGDGGMAITTDHGRTFNQITLPIGQMYHVATDNQVPYWIYSNRQDDGTMRGPSDSPVAVANVPSYLGSTGVGSGLPGADAGRGGRGGRAGGGGGGGGGGRGGRGNGGIGATPWQPNLGGCESGFTLPDPTNPDVVWASCYGNEVTRWEAKTRRARSISPGMHTLDSPPDKIPYRCHWTPPLAIDPFDHNKVYYGCQVIFSTSNGGQSWTTISPDLSTKDPSRLVSSGGIIEDNLGQFYGEVVFAIAPSEIQRGLIWAGTNDGKVWYTRNGGGQWTDVTKNITGLPAWGTVRKIEPGHFDPGTAYVVVDFHLNDNREPFLYKTTDFGATWKKISDTLPKDHPLSYAMSVAENPNRRGMIFAGTGHAFYYSLDDGGRWTQVKDGLPAAPVTWITLPKLWHDVVISTYGRGLFIMSDITLLEQGDKVTTDAAAYVYDPKPAFRLARNGRADITYMVKNPPAEPVRVEILNADGAVIRTIESPARAGLNRLTWDLRYEGPHTIAFRTTPPDNPHIWEEPRFKGRDTRPLVHWGIESAQFTGPIATPGKYGVRMRLGGQTFTKSLEIAKDPSIDASDADLMASTAMQIRIRDDINQSVDMVNNLEVVRKQIEDELKANAGKPDAEKALRDIDQKLLAVELRLVSHTELHSDDKWYVEPYKVVQNLIWLNGVVNSGAGDVAGGADERPTDASVNVMDGLSKELNAAKAAYQSAMDRDVPAFNRIAGGLGLKTLTPTR
ncbi:MAG TPA: hypothetical protein VKH42_16575 [Vicinamibacterales bacterium]|nr:hypothetical protein [Vicinamibacterales bacterium]